MFAFCDQVFRQSVHRRDTNAAADQQRFVAGKGSVVAVAQTCQYVQLVIGCHFAHGFCAFAHNLVKDSQCVFIIVAHGDRAAQEKAFQLNIYKLTRRGDGGGVPRQYHLAHAVCQFFIALNGKERLFHNNSPN